MRWFHEGIDRLHTTILTRLASPIFRQGTTSPSLHDHLAAIDLELPTLTEVRRYTLTVDTLVGPLEAGFQVRWGAQPHLPLLVYHHGIAEQPYEKSFWGIFPPHLSVAAHLVAIRAPFHRSWFELTAGLVTLTNFLAMCAVSVQLMEALRRQFAAQGTSDSLIVGSSLGGFLALLHHLVYGTADGYVPLLAGPDVAHVLLATPYRHFVASEALAQPSYLQALLDFRPAFQASDTARVFPLLGYYDRTMCYAHQHACYTARQVPVAMIARGHITGCLSFPALRHHVLGRLAGLPNII